MFDAQSPNYVGHGVLAASLSDYVSKVHGPDKLSRATARLRKVCKLYK